MPGSFVLLVMLPLQDRMPSATARIAVAQYFEQLALLAEIDLREIGIASDDVACVSIRLASLIVFAFGEAFAVCSRSMALRALRFPSSGRDTSVKSATSAATCSPNWSRIVSIDVGVSSTTS